MMLVALLLVVVPDAALTPGAADPAITQATIATTICVPLYTSKVRHVTQATKRAVVRAYRAKHPDWPKPSYEIDHFVSIEIGGSNDITNLWPQPIAEARLKDVIENRLHRAVCKGTMTLEQAQQAIMRWAP